MILQDTSFHYVNVVFLFYIYWDCQGQKCNLKGPKVYESNTEF